MTRSTIKCMSHHKRESSTMDQLMSSKQHRQKMEASNLLTQREDTTCEGTQPVKPWIKTSFMTESQSYPRNRSIKLLCLETIQAERTWLISSINEYPINLLLTHHYIASGYYRMHYISEVWMMQWMVGCLIICCWRLEPSFNKPIF